MLLSARRAAFAIPLVVAVLTCATHQGWSSGYYRTSRPDGGARPCFPLGADGYVSFWNGIPSNMDAVHISVLAGLFRGVPGGQVHGINDERPLVPFLESLLGASVLGAYWSGVLLNLLVALAAAACAVDLGLALGRGPLLAGALGCLVASARGVGFYAGVPDVHLLAFFWLPIGAWLHERLEVSDEATPWSRVLLFGLACGTAGLTYLGDAALVAFAWFRGIGRTPPARLVAIAAVALAVMGGWRVAGRAAGLPFDSSITGDIPRGFRKLASDTRDAAVLAVTPAPGTVEEQGRARAHAKALLGGARLFANGPVRLLLRPLWPAFGWLLLAGALGLTLATGPERRIAIALFLPPIFLSWPMNTRFDVPRIAYPAVAGLLVAALPALEGLRRLAERVALRVGAGEPAARVAGAAAVALAVLAFAVHESSDLFSEPVLHRRLNFGF